MYSYCLLLHKPDYPGASPQGYVQVRPGPSLEIETLEALHAQYVKDLGFVPDWLQTCPPDEYIGVEDEHEIDGSWFTVEVEGSEDHILPPTAKQIAWLIKHGAENVIP